MKKFIIFWILITPSISKADVYLMCRWEGYTDFIHLFKEKQKAGEKYYSKGVFYRNILRDEQKLSFKVKDSCYFNCAFPTLYTILTAYQLNRDNLLFTDRTQVIVGGEPKSTQCKPVSEELWNQEKVKVINNDNQI